ncbi:MAG: hypothetical protein A2234_04060 [Elusimicrobia bacterium RIFOXYA2_FULL_58_8]|nr:MAG: hypothetical protein A2285_09875 [Elusimicrobia bacterium RIFOXYA12_FULL_57_11]OGS15450.1 MAG: hypothetical protein A2234_04060 [Elusimicrobia bacterium RIFOXYA2_FULL_58_8]
MRKVHTREKDLETIVILAAAALVFFLIFRKNAFIFAAFGLLLLGLFFKCTAAAVSAGWLKFAEVLGTFNTRVILGLVYFVVLTPIALVFRALIKRHVNSPRTAFDGTYFTVRDHSFGAPDFEKMW